jgi:hypothetical protein
MANGKKSNDNKSNNNNRRVNMKYFVIRKYKSNYSEDYRIEKHTDNIDEANKFLSALSLLEQDEYVSFFISVHQFQKPLVLDSEVA